MDTKNKIFTVIGSIALLATAGLGGVYLFADKGSLISTVTNASSNSSSGTPINTTSTTATTSTSSIYKDGTYRASSNYNVPSGAQNSIDTTIIVSGGKITSVTTNDNYTDGTSAQWVGSFEGAVSSDANGQSLADYNPSRVGGASLTTAAFDTVLDQIRTKAST